MGFEETERFLEKPKKPDYEYDSDSEYESDSDCEVNKPRKRKMTEPKVQCAENVSMTNAEYQQLLDTHGLQGVHREEIQVRLQGHSFLVRGQAQRGKKSEAQIYSGHL